VPLCFRYAYNSIEMQLRQFGDVAFLLQSYELAFTSYHQVKRDFQSASTWLYYAGAVVRETKIKRERGDI